MEKKKTQKNTKNSAVPKQKKTEEEKEEIPKSIYEKNENIYIMVNAKPNSKINAITGFVFLNIFF